MTIVNDDYRVVNKFEASLTDDAGVVIYDRHIFIVQATECIEVHAVATDCIEVRAVATECIEMHAVATECIEVHAVATDCIEVHAVAVAAWGMSDI
jgi:hypothetical protein